MRLVVSAPEDEGERLDRWLAGRLPGRSRTAIQRLIREGRVRVGGRRVKPSYPLAVGDEIEVELPIPQSELPQPEPLPLEVIHEDEDLIVVNKPAGMVTHPGAGRPRGTLVNALLHHCRGRLAETGDPARPGIVHRLDRETSGLLVAAKTELAYRSLVEQFKRGEVGKRYLALVWGLIEEDEGLIELPVARDPRQRERMRVTPGGKRAVTEFAVLRRFPEEGKTLVEARPRTGRMHQVRVHFSYIEHPVVGDPKYGRHDRSEQERMMLHAWELELWHPRTGRRVRFVAPPPEEFTPWLGEGRSPCGPGSGPTGGSRSPQGRRGRSPGR